MKEQIQKHRVCAILRGIPDHLVAGYAKALLDGGITMFEVALNTANAYKQITMVKDVCGGHAWVGAGTALTVDHVEKAWGYGAEFILTPGVSAPVLSYCSKNGIPLLPGVLTPSEVTVGLQYGYSTFKLFPAGDFPLRYIQSLKGPFDQTDFMAVGGVSKGNTSEYLENGFIGVGLGSALASAELIQTQNWPQIQKDTHAYCTKIKGCLPETFPSVL